MTIKRFAKESPEVTADLDDLLDRATELVRLAVDRSLSESSNDNSNGPDDDHWSFENMMTRKLKKFPKATREKLSLNAKSRLNADTASKERRYGKLFSRIDHNERVSVIGKADQFAGREEISSRALRLQKAMESQIAEEQKERRQRRQQKRNAGKNASPRSSTVQASATDRPQRVPEIATGADLSDLIADELDDFNLSDLLDPPEVPENRPVELELQLTKITCIDDFKKEVGKDEIAIGAVLHDIYSLPAEDHYFDPKKLGKFKQGKENDLARDVTLPLSLGKIPISDGDWQNRVYTASIYLAETDMGGFNKRKLEELHGMSSHEMRDLLFLAYCVSLTSLWGVSGATKSGVDARGVTYAIGVGAGPFVCLAIFFLITKGLRKGLIRTGITAALKLVALSAKIVGEVISDAVRDEFFPPQVINFHFSIPDGIVDSDLLGLDMGSASPTKVRFEYLQKGKRIDEHKAIYELEFAWKVKTERRLPVPPSPPPVEADPVSPEALANLDKIEHIGVIMLENRSFDQMLGFLANDQDNPRMVNGTDTGRTLGMSNILRARTEEEFSALAGSGGKFNSNAEQVTAQLRDLLLEDQEIEVRAFTDSLIEDDPGHTITNVAIQTLGWPEFITLDNPDTAEESDGFLVDPHWPQEEDLISPTPMPGFANDYFSVLSGRNRLHLQKIATGESLRAEDIEKQLDQIRQIMGYFPAFLVPTYDLLAAEFGVCARWYSSYPGNTWVNRTISMTGRPARRAKVKTKDHRSKDEEEQFESASAADKMHALFITDNSFPWNEESIFRKLDAGTRPDGRKISWACYSQDMPSLLAIDASYASEFRNRLNGTPNRFRTIGRFFEDAQKRNGLPNVFWIDPNFVDIGDLREIVGNREKNPKITELENGEKESRKDREREETGSEMVLDENTANDDHPPADISHGQHFVMEIFNALLQSPDWSQTLLVITYDEHGGFFDHVQPPYLNKLQNPVEAESPAFRSLGARVPAIVVSPWIGRGLVSHTQFDHTSILKTILLKFLGCADNAGERIAKANHLGGLLTESAPRFVEEYGQGVPSNATPSTRKASVGKRTKRDGVANNLAQAKHEAKDNRIFQRDDDDRAFGIIKHVDKSVRVRKKLMQNAMYSASVALRMYEGRDLNTRNAKQRPPTDLANQMNEARKKILEEI